MADDKKVKDAPPTPPAAPPAATVAVTPPAPPKVDDDLDEEEVEEPDIHAVPAPHATRGKKLWRGIVNPSGRVVPFKWNPRDNGAINDFLDEQKPKGVPVKKWWRFAEPKEEEATAKELKLKLYEKDPDFEK